jgi:hypothetical protein
MGARPSSFKKGGGFLNNVDAVIVGYEFTDEFNGEPFKPGKDPKTKKERFHSLNVLLTVRVDGADENESTTLFAGGFDDFSIEDDGKTLVPNEEGHELGANTGWAKFVTALCEAGFPETNLPEDRINYESIIGTRVRLVQRDDEEMKRQGKKRKDKKTGKEYPYQNLVVDQVYELPNAAPAKGKGKTNGKVTSAPAVKSGKTNGSVKLAETPEVDLEQLAKDTLGSIVADAGGSIAKSKLSMKVLTKLMKHDNREDVRKLIFTDEFLSLEDGWNYDKAKGLVSIEA